MMYYELILGRHIGYEEVDSKTGEIHIHEERRKVIIEVDIRSGRQNSFKYLFETAGKIMGEEEYLISLKEANICIVRADSRH